MNLPEPVTPREAQIVWNSIQNPSARRVAKALTAAGKRIHHGTVSRWRAEGWRQVPNRPHPLEAARWALDVAAPLLTGNPAAGVEALSERRDHQEELDGLSDHELLRRAARETLIAVALLCLDLQRHAANLVLQKTLETAGLLTAIAAALRVAPEGLAQSYSIRDEDG
jgi:hypothetical protein